MGNSRIPSRSFNTLLYDVSRNRVTKRSTDAMKLRDEIRWYLHVPSSMHAYMPEIIDYSLEEDLYVTMAWIQSPTVHQLYMENTTDRKRMEAIFQCLQDVLSCMASTSADVTREHLEEMYVHKTVRRLHRLREQRVWVQHIYERGSVRLNGSLYPCPIRYLEEKNDALACLLNHPLPHIVHGDLCFPNMFFHEQQRQFILIDPRGSFGVPGIYGDGRYDLAKVRHSLSGYDLIIADQYYATAGAGELNMELPHSPEQAVWQAAWDERCAHRLLEIRLLEALLFLSMAALHADHPRRQMAMYGLGTTLLFQVLGHD